MLVSPTVALQNDTSTRLGPATFLVAGVWLVLGLVVVVALLPMQANGGRSYQTEDRANLRFHHAVLMEYRNRYGKWPECEDADFILAPLVRGLVKRTPKNLERYFSSHRRDDRNVRRMIEKGPEDIQELCREIKSMDTGFVGCGSPLLRRTQGRFEREILMAVMDRNGASSYQDGSILALLENGAVVTIFRDQ